MSTVRLRASVVAAALFVAFAAVAADEPEAGRCERIAAETQRTEAARRAAVEKGDSAWKAVLPFAVVARRVGSRFDADLAAKQLTELQQQARDAGCEDR